MDSRDRAVPHQGQGNLAMPTPELLRFVIYKDTGKTKGWAVFSTFDETVLGEVKWFTKWRRYCFFPCADLIFDRNCLMLIIDFIDAEMGKRKASNG